MDFQGVGSLIKNKKQVEIISKSEFEDQNDNAIRNLITSPERSVDSPNENLNLKQNQKEKNLKGSQCLLDVQVKELCSKVNRINTFNEAIKAYFAAKQAEQK